MKIYVAVWGLYHVITANSLERVVAELTVSVGPVTVVAKSEGCWMYADADRHNYFVFERELLK